MHTNVTVQQDVSPEQLAEALATSTPQEFAKFWFAFSEKMALPKNEGRIEEFAKAMSPSLGGLRKHAFYKLYRLMQFYEVQEEMG